MVEYIVRVYEDGTVWYNLKGQLHREDGPAREYKDGTKSWWLNGKLHRLDGPAVEYSDGFKEWYINDKHYTEYQFNDYIKKLNRPCVGKKVIVDGIEYELK